MFILFFKSLFPKSVCRQISQSTCCGPIKDSVGCATRSQMENFLCCLQTERKADEPLTPIKKKKRLMCAKNRWKMDLEKWFFEPSQFLTSISYHFFISFIVISFIYHIFWFFSKLKNIWKKNHFCLQNDLLVILSLSFFYTPVLWIYSLKKKTRNMDTTNVLLVLQKRKCFIRKIKFYGKKRKRWG